MAFTTSLLAKTTFGNYRAHAYRITADDATQAIDTGLDVIEWANTAIQSATTGAFKLAINEGAEGTSTLGTIALTGCASGDEYFVTVYGR